MADCMRSCKHFDMGDDCPYEHRYGRQKCVTDDHENFGDI
jgi:hypothetical protein